jgi:hypothetical protein
MAIKHAKTAAPDDGSAEVNAEQWNANHSIDNNTIQPAHVQAVGGEAKVTFDASAGHKHDGVLARKQTHANLLSITADQHHNQIHKTTHARSGTDPLTRTGVIVDPAGYGDYVAIQAAIDSLS